MIRVKYQAHVGRSFNSKNGNGDVEHIGGEELVQMSLRQADMLSSGAVESAVARQERLAAIVGRILDLIPEKEWLQVTDMQYTLEEAP